MLDIKFWLETAGEPVADTCFPPGEAPDMPYVVYLDTVTRGGADMRNAVRRHALSIERYSAEADDSTALEALFDVRALKYRKEKQWLQDNECYMTVYNLETDLIEREVLT